MRTATKAIRQKRAAQVEVSREITHNGSTVTQMTVGRLARERRWAKGQYMNMHLLVAFAAEDCTA